MNIETFSITQTGTDQISVKAEFEILGIRLDQQGQRFDLFVAVPDRPVMFVNLRITSHFEYEPIPDGAKFIDSLVDSWGSRKFVFWEYA